MTNFLQPGSTIGIIGGGFDSYLLSTHAHQLGFKTIALVKNKNDVLVSNVDDFFLTDKFDYQSMKQIALNSDTLLYQSNEIDSFELEKIASEFEIVQGTDLFNIAQDRYIEKKFLYDLNINITPFYAAITYDDLILAIEKLGLPAVLKPIIKGSQPSQVIYSMEDVYKYKYLFETGTFIVEPWIEKKNEFAIMGTKSINGEVKVAPIIGNVYRNRELISSTVLIENNQLIEDELNRIVNKIGENINYIGIFGVSFMTSTTGAIFVKQIYAGPTYSANIYENSTGYSQYELHLRAVSGWPIPEICPITNSSILKILPEFLNNALKLLKEKPQWKFVFNQDQKRRGDIGYILISSSNIEDLKKDIEDTEIWKIN